jgi:hypothetical protein
MRNLLLLSTLIVLSLCGAAKASCGLNWVFIKEDYPSGEQCSGGFHKAGNLASQLE